MNSYECEEDDELIFEGDVFLNGIYEFSMEIIMFLQIKLLTQLFCSIYLQVKSK